MKYAALLLVVLAGCPLRDPVPVDPVYPAVQSACANFVLVGCPEGLPDRPGECERIMLIASKLRPLPFSCWAAASSANAAKGCGQLRCER